MIEYSGQRREFSPQPKQQAPSAADEVSDISTEILLWLANNPDHLGRFLDLSGIRADQIRAMVNQPSFQSGLVTFVMNHEPDLIEFCTARSITTERVIRCHQRIQHDAMAEEVTLV